jgi:hypothetical protein
MVVAIAGPPATDESVDRILACVPTRERVLTAKAVVPSAFYGA